MSRGNILATAGTMDDILSSIADFYCGSTKRLVETGPGSWKVVSMDGSRDLSGVRVTLFKSRYRFEMVA